MIAEIGQATIWLALFSCCWTMIAIFLGMRYEHLGAVQSGRNAVIVTFCLITTATFALVYSFLTDDFSLFYVYEGSSLKQPVFYKITALWGKMSGSLLFWLWLLTLFSAVVVWQNRQKPSSLEKSTPLADYALITLAFVSLFFVVLVTGLIEGVRNPLARFPQDIIRPDGLGMNPLLQTPSMAIHPPLLYIGFISLTVPFSFAMGALISGNVSNLWLHLSRRWTLFSWITLTVGIALGGNWAYQELGWGGYWAWDPVENASFMPWLLCSAYLHSAMIQEKRNMLKIWNIILVSLSFGFTILGTFITRSGIISSVHAFAQSQVGGFFAFFLVVLLAGTTFLILIRSNKLKSPNQIGSLLSRESAFVLNNWILVALTAMILFGTLWPIISEAVTQQKMAVPEAYFNQIVIIPGLILLLLTGIGPIISWKTLTLSNFNRVFAKPTAISIVFGLLALGFFFVNREIETSTSTIVLSALCVLGATFVITAIVEEFYRGGKLRAKRNQVNLFSGMLRLLWKNRRRYGGYIVHIGIVILYIGIMGSKGYDRLATESLTQGQSIKVRNYEFLSGNGFQERHENFDLSGINFEIKKNGQTITTMQPARAFYHTAGQGDQDTIESAIHHIGLNNLYIALGPLPSTFPNYDDEPITVEVYHNPLINLVWVGIAVMFIGGWIAILESTVPETRTPQTSNA